MSEQDEKKSTPWYKTWWGVVLIIALVLGALSVLGVITFHSRDKYSPSDRRIQNTRKVDWDALRKQAAEANYAFGNR